MIPDLSRVELAATALRVEIGQLRAQIDQLCEKPMWPAPCREEWQSRAGSQARYLYMVFRRGPGGAYSGPGGRQKVYVGCGEGDIEEARAMGHRREQRVALRNRLSVLCSIQIGLESRSRDLVRYAEGVVAAAEAQKLAEFETPNPTPRLLI